MRRLRYNVATSLDGFIARTDGTFDWIVEDSSIDFAGLTSQFDAAVMGRCTYEVMKQQGQAAALPGVKLYVCSTTLAQAEVPNAVVIPRDVVDTVRALKLADGKDIWLFGGAVLFRALLDAGLVDTVEVAQMPVLLGAGIPMLSPGTAAPRLELTDVTSLPASGIVMLTYAVHGQAGAPAA
ncbi:MAG: dihydrofolate reductase family protein [Vicinamibacterales bacterium]